MAANLTPIAVANIVTSLRTMLNRNIEDGGELQEANLLLDELVTALVKRRGINTLPAKKCEQCGKEFQPQRKNKRFCDDRCRYEAFMAARGGRMAYIRSRGDAK